MPAFRSRPSGRESFAPSKVPEPEGDGPEGFSTPGADAGEDTAAAAAASARRLATASAVAGELEKARASVSSFKSSLGKV